MILLPFLSTVDGAGKGSNVLMEANTIVLSTDQCEKAYGGGFDKVNMRLSIDSLIRLVRNSKNDPRLYWKELNSVLNPPVEKSKSTLILSKNGQDLPANMVSDYMNDYFSSVGPNLLSCINIDNNCYLNDLNVVTTTHVV